MTEYGLALEFDRDSLDYALGFEMGRLWARVTSGDVPFTQTIHAANAEMVMRLAEAHHLGFHAEDLGAIWTRVTLAADEDGLA